MLKPQFNFDLFLFHIIHLNLIYGTHKSWQMYNIHILGCGWMAGRKYEKKNDIYIYIEIDDPHQRGCLCPINIDIVDPFHESGEHEKG